MGRRRFLMGKKKGKRTTPKRSPIGNHLYVARVIKDEAAPGMVMLSVYRDQDTIAVADGDEFITFTTLAPLFRDGKPEGGSTLGSGS
jgi:hypothetical protein